MDVKIKSQRFNELLENHKGILINVARAYCQSIEERQDLIQEISIQIWLSMDKYNQDYKMSTWLYRIAINTAISYYRKENKKITKSNNVEYALSRSSESYDIEKENKLVLLEQFIHELDEFDRALILLYLEGRKHNEISNIIGISTSNVGTKISRIKNKLKQKFLK